MLLHPIIIATIKLNGAPYTLACLRVAWRNGFRESFVLLCPLFLPLPPKPLFLLLFQCDGCLHDCMCERSLPSRESVLLPCATRHPKHIHEPLDAVVNQHLNNTLSHMAYRNMRRQHPGKNDGKSLLEVGSLRMRI